MTIVDLGSGSIKYGILPVTKALGDGLLTLVQRVSKWFSIP